MCVCVCVLFCVCWLISSLSLSCLSHSLSPSLSPMSFIFVYLQHNHALLLSFPLPHTHTLTHSHSLFFLSLMSFIIVCSRRLRCNPDNIGTPIAASLSDLVTLLMLSAIAQVGTTCTKSKDVLMRAWIECVYN